MYSGEWYSESLRHGLQCSLSQDQHSMWPSRYLRTWPSLEISPLQMSHTLLSFIVEILLHSEIQKMAQKELDMVTRKKRLPTLEDRLRLPFINAVCKEVIRWRLAGPLGKLLLNTHLIHAEIWRQFTAVPNTTTRDNVYKGFFIPKGLYSWHACLSLSHYLICHLRCCSVDEHIVRWYPNPRVYV